MRDSELAIKRVQDGFDDFKQSHDYLNDTITIWATVEDSRYQEVLEARYREFLILFYDDRTVFKYKQTVLGE